MSNHPFLAAVQAAYDTHGLPDDVEYVHVTRSMYVTLRVMVQALGGPCAAGMGPSVQEAYDKAIANRDREAQQLADASARIKAREVLIAAGLSPELLAKG